MSQDMESLLRGQVELHGRIARSYDNLMKAGMSKITPGLVEARLSALDANWRKFDQQHDLLRSTYWKDLATSDYVKNDFHAMVEETCLQHRGRFLDLANDLRSSLGGAPAPTPSLSGPGPSRTTLPRIQLPQFSGKYEDWPSFRDLFSSIITNDAAISSVEKLHYLKTAVKGEAEQLIRNLTITSDNFERAWSTLSEHFENKRLLVKSYFSSLSALQKMKGESIADLRKIFHCMTNVVGSLEGIGRPICSHYDFLVHTMVELLDTRSRREWENSVSNSTAPPEYDTLKRFLERRIRALEAMTPSKGETGSTTSEARASGNQARARTLHAQRQESGAGRCVACSKNHYLPFCPLYQRKQPKERKELANASSLCLNCLGRHKISDCKSKKTCVVCSEQHHTTLHDACVPTSPPGPSASGSNATTLAVTHVAHQPSPEKGTVLLATARVRVNDKYGVGYEVRALIDPGSKVSIVSEAVVQRLRLARSRASTAIFGVGGSKTGTSRGQVSLRVAARTGDAEVRATALVLPKLTLYETKVVRDGVSWPHIEGLTLADPDFAATDPIELLLGADVYGTILQEGLRSSGSNAPIAQRTILGWILTGMVGNLAVRDNTSSHHCLTKEHLPRLVQQFWEQEELPSEPVPLTKEDRECEDHFQATHYRNALGRYVVRLPKTAAMPPLGDTRVAAARLFSAMERKFRGNLEFQQRYQDFMREYETLGHMEPAASATCLQQPGLCYLPHHGVIKEASTSTKLRVVFNGSQRASNGKSLNEHLLTGPNLLPALCDVVLRWRQHRYAMTADIEKMYRQIIVHPEDRDLQRILWKRENESKVQEYRLNTVTYGLACAPFLAIRTLHQLADDEEDRYPLGATALRHDTYVDDVLTGADTLEEASLIRNELIGLCMAGGFPLKKWAANTEDLLKTIPQEHKAHQDPRIWQTAETYSTLGLQWHPRSDSFCFRVRAKKPETPTKRIVLSEAARLFDPLGWLAPVVVTAKILIQTTWLQHLDWDTPLATSEALQWYRFQQELPLLEQLRIPRWSGGGSPDTSYEMHGFADASERAYGAAVYLRSISKDDGISTCLLMSKTRVAPLQQVSLPRLELCAATLLVKLVNHVQATLKLKTMSTHLWSDSTVTLAWIQGHPTRWKTYVANRVSLIQQALPEAQWHHVTSQDNPADCASRGLLPGELIGHQLWWQGSPWLRAGEATWPSLQHTPQKQLPDERVITHVAAVDHGEEPSLLLRFSTFSNLLRVTAWCRRWLRVRSRAAGPRLSTLALDSAELDEALNAWIRVVQSSFYAAELSAIAKNQEVARKSSLAKLRPFIDEKGVMRVGGRLKHALLSYDERHPALLPTTSHLTTLVIDAYHRKTLHGGVQLTLGTLRQKYWIPRGRFLVKGRIHNCLTCVRWRAAAPQPVMGSLPGPRVTPSRPFLHTGIDYAGPIHLRTTKGRGHRAYKGFIAVFVCFSTRAVHLEAVSDYTAEAFLAAFRRFTSRRGLCQHLYSDCGTNFVGADAQLRSLFKAASREADKIVHQLADDGVRWHFNPPAAPHFGGIWEAAVKSLKHHLRRVIGDATLTFEEMATLLTQIEACLNSRPLNALSDDPDDLTALTPGHFLIGAALNAVPEPSLVNEPENRLTRWQHLQQMREHFWHRWSREYIQGLVARPKWWKESKPTQVGTLCLIRQEVSPPFKWPLGRIVRIHPGDDQCVRVVTVRTATSELIRSVTKIVPLPIMTAEARDEALNQQ